MKYAVILSFAALALATPAPQDDISSILAVGFALVAILPSKLWKCLLTA